MSPGSHQLVKIFPEVLSHQSKQRQKSPTESIKACVAIIGISTSFHTHVSFWTLAVNVAEKSIIRSSAVFSFCSTLYLIFELERFVISRDESMINK